MAPACPPKGLHLQVCGAGPWSWKAGQGPLVDGHGMRVRLARVHLSIQANNAVRAPNPAKPAKLPMIIA